jgi:hypothetical protein
MIVRPAFDGSGAQLQVFRLTVSVFVSQPDTVKIPELRRCHPTNFMQSEPLPHT